VPEIENLGSVGPQRVRFVDDVKLYFSGKIPPRIVYYQGEFHH
jgi:hypothetical protein